MAGRVGKIAQCGAIEPTVQRELWRQNRESIRVQDVIYNNNKIKDKGNRNRLMDRWVRYILGPSDSVKVGDDDHRRKYLVPL